MAIVSCKKPPEPLSEDYAAGMEHNGAVVFYTSLADSLSEKTLETMEIHDVMGVKVKYLSGHENRYFAYEADPDLAIRAISQIPFLPYAKYSDSHCRRISCKDLEVIRQNISTMELSSSSFFWAALSKLPEAYECIKSPYRHTLLIERESNLIFHRMELISPV
jgi:hypothetical protein